MPVPPRRRECPGARKLLNGVRFPLLAAALAASLVGGASHRVGAQVLDPSFWAADGEVNALAVGGGKLFFGGSFHHVGRATGGYGRLDATSGALQGPQLRVRGSVYACIPDGSGGVYLGGSFTSVAGVGRTNLAHVRADGSLDGWNPQANGTVYALLASHGLIFAGGSFTTVDGQPRYYIAAIDPASGHAVPWDTGATGAVYALAADDSSVVVGGAFTWIGAKARSHLAALDPATGLARAWNPFANGDVRALATSGSRLFVGGAFTTIGGQGRLNLAAFDRATGLVTSWNPMAGGDVLVLLADGGRLFAGGTFTGMGGQVRTQLASFDLATGDLTAWSPVLGANSVGATPRVASLAAQAGTIYAGGSFGTVSGQPRSNGVALDAETGSVAAWNPICDDQFYGTIQSLCPAGSSVLVGGTFNFIGGVPRGNFAGVDLVTGELLPWDVGANGTVWSIATDGTTVYVGGQVGPSNSSNTARLVAFDIASGTSKGWNPEISGATNAAVMALALDGSRVYAGGYFATVNALDRYGLAAFDAGSGALLDWHPAGGGLIRDIAAHGSDVFVAGEIGNIGGLSCGNLAALDAVTGAARPWNSGDGYRVLALEAAGSTVYAGGEFTRLGGAIRSGLAAVDARTGATLPWNPSPANVIGSTVRGLAIGGATVYVGGGFATMGGVQRLRLAAVDAATGALLPWNPGAGGPVYALALDGDDVFAGGSFAYISGWYGTLNLARLCSGSGASSTTAVSPAGGESFALGASLDLGWAASAPAPGVQSVDLWLSRQGASGPWELLAAGVANTGHYAWIATGPEADDCYLRVDARNFAGALVSDVSDASFHLAGVLAVETQGQGPGFALGPLSPNPARNRASVEFTLPASTTVRLAVVDVQGRERLRLADGEQSAGRHVVKFDAARLGPGMYFVSFESGTTRLARKLVVVR